MFKWSTRCSWKWNAQFVTMLEKHHISHLIWMPSIGLRAPAAWLSVAWWMRVFVTEELIWGKQRPLAVRGQNAFKKRAKTPGVVEGPSIPLSWELIWHFYQRQGQCLWSLKNCRKMWAHPNYVNSKSIKNVIWIILGILSIRGGYTAQGRQAVSLWVWGAVTERERKREREG